MFFKLPHKVDKLKYRTGLKMIRKKKTSWLAKTGQIWKFWLFAFLIGSDGLLFVLMLLKINSSEFPILDLTRIEGFHIGMLFMALAVFALLWLIFSIKCPACKKRPVFRIIRKSEVNRWVTELITFQKCPFCAFPADRPGSSFTGVTNTFINMRTCGMLGS
jgi:hypothetical protein